MGVKFLAQGNNSSRMPQLGIEPGAFRLPGRCPDSLLLPPYFALIGSMQKSTLIKKFQHSMVCQGVVAIPWISTRRDIKP